MIIQTLLLASLGLIFIYAVMQKKRSAVVSVAIATLSVLGGILVVAPELANSSARFIGVGRGADLILYCFVVISIAAIFNIHLRLRKDHEVLTALAREFALQGAKEPEHRN